MKYVEDAVYDIVQHAQRVCKVIHTPCVLLTVGEAHRQWYPQDHWTGAVRPTVQPGATGLGCGYQRGEYAFYIV